MSMQHAQYGSLFLTLVVNSDQFKFYIVTYALTQATCSYALLLEGIGVSTFFTMRKSQ